MSLERLERTPFTQVIREILIEKRTGRLSIVSESARSVIFWSQGEIILAASSDPEDSLGRFLLRREAISEETVAALDVSDPADVIPGLDAVELRGTTSRNSLLREWAASIVVPLFTLESGTTAFADEEALEPEKRFFVSTPAIVLEGARSISSGLLLRACLGDLKREIQPSQEPPYGLGILPLEEPERDVASSLRTREPIEKFIKRFPGESLLAARVTIAMLTLGVFDVDQPRSASDAFDDTDRDLALLASIGGDARALRAIGLAKQLGQLDYYELLDVPRAAPRNLILAQIEDKRREYDPITFPQPARPSVKAIHDAIDRAHDIFEDVDKRQSYDRVLASGGGAKAASVTQQIARHNLAIQNYRKAEELFVKEDYYGAIVLLQQVTRFAPDFAQAWHLLGDCQQKNPRWQRKAIESFQKALSIDPNQVETMISLGDLYADQHLYTRARAFYEDVLKIESENVLALARLKKLGKVKA